MTIPPTGPKPPVTVYPAAKVLTMDPARPVADAIAVVGDRVRAVGGVDELRAYGELIVDDRYAGAVLLPGFVEAHTHAVTGRMWKALYVGSFERTGPDGRVWPGCTDAESVIARLAAADAQLPDSGFPILAWGLDPIMLPGDRFDRRHLDRVSTTRPIVVMHQSLHTMTVNTPILRADHIDRDTAVPGVVFDADGEPTGELQEPVAMALVKSLPVTEGLGFDEAGLWNFGADAANHGVTTLTDLGSSDLLTPGFVDDLRRVVDDPRFPARLSAFHMGAGVGDVGVPLAEAARRVRELREEGTDKLHLGHVKLVLDGSIQSGTARLQAPGYLNLPDRGLWLIPPETFGEVFTEFHRAGSTVHVHCNGDEATELFLDTVEDALTRFPRRDHRHTVTHSQLSTPAQYRRMAALGMCANLFSNHLWYYGDLHHDVTVGPDRARRMNAAATALRSGVPITLHSDSPVTPLAPLATAAYAVTRTTPTGRVLGAEERLSAEQALRAVTLGAAYTLKLDHLVGSLEAGKFADVAVLAADPTAVPAAEMKDVPILGSMVGGVHFTPHGSAPGSAPGDRA